MKQNIKTLCEKANILDKVLRMLRSDIMTDAITYYINLKTGRAYHCATIGAWRKSLGCSRPHGGPRNPGVEVSYDSMRARSPSMREVPSLGHRFRWTKTSATAGHGICMYCKARIQLNGALPKKQRASGDGAHVRCPGKPIYKF